MPCQETNDQEPRSSVVRVLNDAFRKLGQGKGVVLVTDGIASLGPEFVAEAVAAVRQFDTFTKDNDPWGEHDFGAIDLKGEKVFWKIDLYDVDLPAYSPNPSDPDQTRRVLTIMLASEY